jgi:LysR family transcriptional activator of nhaA
VQSLNFHHLFHFWSVARVGNLTRAATQLHVAPSALSSQIRQLEAELGEPLFQRVGRGLVLTEAGAIVHAHATEVFRIGGELVSTIREGRNRTAPLRVGAVATLSRNFQRSFLLPVLSDGGVPLKLSSGSLGELLEQLHDHALDVVLSNRLPAGADPRMRTRCLARQSISLVSTRPHPGFRFPEHVLTQPLIVPGLASEVRTSFDALCERMGIRPRVIAEVDDMALLRLLARDSEALVLVASVVVRDELRDGRLHELCTLPELSEAFYAITTDRRFPHPMLSSLFDRAEADFLAA